MTKINTAPYALTTTNPRFAPDPVTPTNTGVFNGCVPELVDIRVAAEERNFEILDGATIRYWHTAIGAHVVSNELDEVSAALYLLKPVVSFLNDELLGFDFERRIVVINPLRMSFDISHLWSDDMNLTPRQFNSKDVPKGVTSEWAAFAEIARVEVANHLDELKANEHWAKDISMLMGAMGGKLDIETALEYAKRNAIPEEKSKCNTPADLVVRFVIDAIAEVERVSEPGVITNSKKVKKFVKSFVKDWRTLIAWTSASPVMFWLLLNTLDAHLKVIIDGDLLWNTDTSIPHEMQSVMRFLESIYRGTQGK